MAAAAAMATALACCGRADRRTPDDTIVVVLGSVVRDLDPRFALTNHDVKLSRLVAPGLTTIDTPTMEPALDLAESLTRVDDLTWEATLRPSLRFSDGSPVTAADVAFTYQSVMDPAVGSLYESSFKERFRRVEAVSPLRVRFHLEKPLATLWSDLTFGIVSARASGDLVVGAGAYRIESFDEEDVNLVRSDFYATPPPMRRIRVRSVRDSNARNLMMVGGSADFTLNSMRVDLVDYLRGRARVVVESAPSAILSYLLLQTEDPLLSDVRVRRAIAYAIDRESILSSKFAGRAVLATGLLAPMHWAYEREVATYARNLERAGELLDAAGYPDPDGPGGEPRMRLTYKTSADPFRLSIARVLARQLAAVDIEVEVRSFEFGTFFADIKRGDYQLASMQTPAISEPDFYFTFFHSSRIPSAADPHTHNRWRYKNSRVDELASRGRAVVDVDERRAIYSELQKILARDLPIVPLWHEDNIALLNRDLEGFRLTPNAGLEGLLHVEKAR